MEWANFEGRFADLIHSLESAVDSVEKITKKAEEDIYMRIANDRRAANGFRPKYPKCKIPQVYNDQQGYAGQDS